MPRLIVEPVAPGPNDGADGDIWLNTSTLDLYGPKERRTWPRAGLIGEPAKGSAKVGPPGKSAYELAVEGGFRGTLEQWLRSLRGRDGAGGMGPPGPQGPPGSAVDLTGVPDAETDHAGPFIDPTTKAALDAMGSVLNALKAALSA